MYTLTNPVKYDWSVVRYGGLICPYFKLTERNSIHICFVVLYTAEAKVVGTWVGSQMPQTVKAAIARTIQERDRDWVYVTPEELQGLAYDILE